MSWVDAESDSIFGPQFKDNFDFTLAFEHTVLTAGPASLLIAVLPVYFFLYRGTKDVVLPGKLLWLKLTAAVALVAIGGANLVFWSTSTLPARNTAEAIAAATLTCVSAICLIPILYLEHRHTLGSTAYLALWLLFTCLCDITRSRSLFLRQDLVKQGILTTVTVVLKACLFILEERSKKSLIKDERTRNNITPEATSGFFSRILFLWMYPVFSYGFKNIIRVNSLHELAPALATQHVNEELAAHWSAGNGTISGSLALALLRTCKWSYLANTFPQLCCSAFIVAQPLLLRSIVLYTGSTEKLDGQRNGLILAAAFVYGGIALSNSASNHVNMRVHIRIRGMLLAEISKKSLLLNQSEAKKADSLTLMNTDIETVLYAVSYPHKVCPQILELAANVYILSTVVKQASFLFAIPVVVTAVTGVVVSKRLPLAKRGWFAVAAARISMTSDVLSQIKIVKMMGLQNVMTNALQKMRVDELRESRKSRFWLVMYLVLTTLCECSVRPLVLGAALFWTGLGNQFTPHVVFTALASLTLLGIGLDTLLLIYYTMANAYASLGRIEEYLALEERVDSRQTDVAAFNESANKTILAQEVTGSAEQQLPTYALPPNRVIEVLHGFIAVRGVESPVLKDITLSIDRGQFAIVTGPTGSGKSTLLKAILGEMDLVSGSMYVESGNSAYCDQTPWVRNASIRDNIIGNSPPDSIWYDTVLVGCDLKRDIEQLPDGDQTMAGSNGENLSGGQKQRVALARALFARAPYVILDDVLAALDKATASQIMENIFGKGGLLKRSQSTAILATHSVQFLDMADHILVIDEGGHITTATNVEEIIQNEHSRTIINDLSCNPECTKTDSTVEKTTTAYAANAETEADEIRMQRGDSGNYSFYARSFKKFGLMCYLLLICISKSLENFSDAYLRIWMELDPTNQLFFIGYALIGVSPAFLQGIAMWLWFMHCASRSAVLLHGQLLDVIMCAKLHFLTEKDHGSILNRFNQDMWLTAQELPLTGFRASYNLFRLAGNVVVIVALNQYTGIGIPIIAIAFYFVQLVYLRTARQLRCLAMEAEAPLCAQFTECAEGIHHIRAFGWGHQEVQAGYRLIDNSQNPQFLTLGANKWLKIIMDSFTFVIGVALVGLAVWSGYVTTSSGIGLSMVALISLSGHANMFVDQWMAFETALGALVRLRSVIKNTPIEQDPADEYELPENWPAKGFIVMEDVVARYNPESAGAPILDGVSLEIPEKSKVGIVGRTGSGKSSLLMALLGFMDYTGTIAIDGVNIARVPRQRVREVITTIAQGHLVFTGTFRENLFPWSIGVAKEQSEMDPFIAGDLLEKLGIIALLGENQEKLDKNISEAELSHGQKQLISITRSCLRQITQNTKIIILDEATSSLDTETEKKVLEVLNEVFSDCTVLAIAHRTETLEGTNLTVTMSDGKVVSVVNREVQEKELPEQS